MDVGAPEVGLIATNITRWRCHRGGDHSSNSSRGFFNAKVVPDPAVLQLCGGSDTFCVVDNVLELAAARTKTSWRSTGHRERRCRSKVRPLTRSGDFDAAADRQLSTLSGRSDPDEDVPIWRRVVIPSGARCARAALPPDYELRNDLNVAPISETKIAGCSQAAKWVPLGNLL